jgi:protein associated with RNAse G/E
MVRTGGSAIMQRDFLVECRSYDKTLRGSWQAYKLNNSIRLGDEQLTSETGECERLWLPAGTPMNWSSGTRPLRNNCLQVFWPQRWYMLSAFYNDRVLMRTYANIIQPAVIDVRRLSYIDLELSILVEPDLSYEILTQAEFEHAAYTLRYSEDTRAAASEALRTLTSVIQRSVGVFVTIPYQLNHTDFHMAYCNDR